MTLTDIHKPSPEEKERFLSAMLDTIENYNKRLDELEERYEQIGCSLISPCYFNFRDALFHYEKAYQSHETIQLYCEQNAMQEHLHRALKDGCVKYLQILNERLEILYNYSCTDEHFNELKGLAERSACKQGKELKDIDALGLDTTALRKFLPKNIKKERYWLLCEYLYCANFYRIKGKRKVLQKCIHALRNLELDSRNGSMQILQPFSISPDDITNKAQIDTFFENCDQQLLCLKDEGVGDFVVAAKILQTSHTRNEK